MSYNLSTFIYKAECLLFNNENKKINDKIFIIKSHSNLIYSSICKIYDDLNSPLFSNNYLLLLKDHNEPNYPNDLISLDLRYELARILIFSLDGKVLIFKDDTFIFKKREELDENNLVTVKILNKY